MLSGDGLIKLLCFAALFIGKFFQLYLTGRTMDAIIVTVSITKTIPYVYIIVSAYFLVLPVLLGFIFLHTVYKNFEKKFLLTVELCVASVVYVACVVLLYALSLDEDTHEDLSFKSYKTLKSYKIKAITTIISILVTQTAHIIIVSRLVYTLERIENAKINNQNREELEGSRLSDMDSDQTQDEAPLDEPNNDLEKQINKETLFTVRHLPCDNMTDLEDINNPYQHERNKVNRTNQHDEVNDEIDDPNPLKDVNDKYKQDSKQRSDVKDKNKQDLKQHDEVNEKNKQQDLKQHDDANKNEQHDLKQHDDINDKNEQKDLKQREDVNDKNEHNDKQHEDINDENTHDPDNLDVNDEVTKDGNQHKEVKNIVVHDPNSHKEENDKILDDSDKPKEANEEITRDPNQMLSSNTV